MTKTAAANEGACGGSLGEDGGERHTNCHMCYVALLTMRCSELTYQVIKEPTLKERQLHESFRHTRRMMERLMGVSVSGEASEPPDCCKAHEPKPPCIGHLKGPAFAAPPVAEGGEPTGAEHVGEGSLNKVVIEGEEHWPSVDKAQADHQQKPAADQAQEERS